MKKLFSLGVFSLFLINLVSAISYSGYNRFSIMDFFDYFLGTENLIFVALFVIIFAMIYSALSRVPFFRDASGNPNKFIVGMVSVATTFIAVYYGFYRNGLNIENAFYGLGISSSLLYPLLGVIIVATLILIIWKLRMGISGLLIMLGLSLLAITIFTELIYEKGIAGIIGLVSFVAGLLFNKVTRNGLGASGRGIYSAGQWGVQNHGLGQKKSKWQVFALGILTIVLGIALGSFAFTIIGIFILVIGLIWWFLTRPKKVTAENGIITNPRNASNNTRNNKQGLEERQRGIQQQREQSRQIPAQSVREKEIRKQRTEQEKLNLARKIGIKNLQSEYSKLEKEYEIGIKNAEQLSKTSTRLGWNKTKEGNKYYKAWFRQYTRLDQIRKRMKEIKQRVEHLNSQKTV